MIQSNSVVVNLFEHRAYEMAASSRGFSVPQWTPGTYQEFQGLHRLVSEGQR